MKSTTIQKCFRNAGVLNTDLDVIALDEEDPFQNIDDDVEMSSSDFSYHGNPSSMLSGRVCEW